MYRYNSGPAAGNLYRDKYTLTLDWSYDAIYFRDGNKWHTLGTGEKTIEFEWDNIATGDKKIFIDMLNYLQENQKEDCKKTSVDTILDKINLKRI